MNKTTQLASRFREVMLNGRWVANTNLKEQLSQVSLQQAHVQVGKLNTIAALAFHINYYIEGINTFFEGGKLEIKDKYSFDLPSITSEAMWSAFTEQLCANAETFAAHVEKMPERQLEEVFVDKNYGDYQRNIEGMIEHGYYHLGQITLIRKLISEKKAG